MLTDGRSVDVQYSHWQNGHPVDADTEECVVVTQYNEWVTFDCDRPQKYVCQESKPFHFRILCNANNVINL